MAVLATLCILRQIFLGRLDIIFRPICGGGRWGKPCRWHGLNGYSYAGHLLGPVCCATAQSHRRVLQAPIDDTTSALLEFTSGADASLTTMMATAPYWRFHLLGASGWALMPDQNLLEWSGLGGEIKRKEFAPVDTLALELDVFAGAVCGGAAFPVTGGRRCAELRRFTPLPIA